MSVMDEERQQEYTSGREAAMDEIQMNGNGHINDDDDDEDEILGHHPNTTSKCCSKRRFQIILLVSFLITLVSLCVIVPVTVVQAKRRKEEARTNMHSTKIYGSAWVPLGNKLLAEVGQQEFGESVSLSGDGNFLAVGSNAMDTFAGQIEIRQYTGLLWRSLGTNSVLKGSVAYENFGYAVQLSKTGKIVCASGKGSEDINGDVKGVVRCYTLDESEGEWNPFGITVKGDVPGDQFGVSLSLASDGKSFIVGADNLRGPGGERNGYAKVYAWSSVASEWRQWGSTIYGLNGERTGYAVAMSGDGNTVCVGDRWYKKLDFGKSGRVRCFFWNDNDWYKKGFDIVGQYPGGEMGYSLALNYDGTVVAAGNRYGGNQRQGSVTVFQFKSKNSKWMQVGSEQISIQKNDQGGFKVDLNANGDVVTWTARGYNGEDGTDQGVVRVARWDGKDWSKLGNDLLGDSAKDYFGESVAINDIGTIVAASANTGTVEYVRAYTLN
eukprot:CAMPEP_0194140418 /NCGR_PEP_ID=MMETSP0152-20130528/9965_1 /TAXON_ID=1049557 /ORGANISM="Thalassiothrix antarctica, Strain L6-D1" /LENGTH=494 /DNA_ID=CAMNT_0038838655 /DNA_START=124 /DNA_END=1608 /DNA_ORIENTATION=+